MPGVEQAKASPCRLQMAQPSDQDWHALFASAKAVKLCRSAGGRIGAEVAALAEADASTSPIENQETIGAMPGF